MEHKSKIVTCQISQLDLDQIKRATETELISSRLSCFSITNGIRPGEFSVLVGQQGNGKSAFCKTVGRDAAISGVNTLFILSEEKTSVYKYNLNIAFSAMAKNKPENYLERLYFDSMIDWDKDEKNEEYFFTKMQQAIDKLGVKLIVFDNFSTSFFSSMGINKQGDVITRIRKFASDNDIAMLGVFHTIKGTDIYKKALCGEDVRGNATTTNTGSYNYILTTFFRATPTRAILFIDKARYHGKANKTYWELNYCQLTSMYTSSRELQFDQVADLVNAVPTKKKKGFN